MEKKIFVLTTQWSVDYESDMSVEVFTTLEEAQSEMKKDYEKSCAEFEQMDEHYFSLKGMSAEINERGDYTRNHIDWRIWEKTLSV